MNVYDFDGTIYDGESVLDFYFFSVKKDIKLLRYAWVVFRTWRQYKSCLITEEELMAVSRKFATEYVRRIPDLEQWVKEFWDKNEKKIKHWYGLQQKEDDIVVSASFDVLLKEICRRLGIKHYISSMIDSETGEVSVLCFNKNKRILWEQKYEGIVPDNFYTDSELDSPLVEISNHAYKVSGESVEKIK